ncbi:MAG: 2-oxo acid dehydrogenase subunit E2 [Deltaproteobacteria bacterium]|nr:2-oxo acid dehydrogenase subunit E2 [Deltaproteobacteria bacterium]
MSVEILMPKWGMTMKEGMISKWFKQEGESVEAGEDLFEVETEKITNAVEAAASGVLFQIVVPEGATVGVGAVVAIVAESDEQPERVEGAQTPEAATEAPVPAQAKAGAEKKKFVPASPAARRLAKELGIDLGMVAGSGPEGRVTEADVTKHHASGPPPARITPLAEEMARQADLDISQLTGTGEGGKITRADVEQALVAAAGEEAAGPVKTIPFSGLRKSIAENMQASLKNTAQLTAFTEVDVTEMVRFRDQVRQEYKGDESIKISYNDIILLAVSRVLKRFPIMNSTLIEEEILLHDSVNLGIAVSLKEGLMVPVIREADKKNLLQIAREARELAQKAREGSLEVDEVTGGTFTVSNVSMLQVDGFTPILRPPETGILGVCRVREKPGVHDGQIAIRSMMFLSLTFDHSVVDGQPAMTFLETLARRLEHPALIMA